MRAVAHAAAAIALAAPLFADAEVLAPRVAAGLFAAELRTLDQVAGVRDGAGDVRVDPIPVRLHVEGLPWVQEAAAAAVLADGGYDVGEGPHRLVGELAIDGRAAAARWSLERRGWSVHAPSPTTRRLLPALAIVPLVLGAMAQRRWGRAPWIMLAVAACAQALSWLWPWPASLPAASVPGQLAASPLLAPLFGVARAMDDQAVAWAGGVIALCLVLAWFDHRRTRDRNPVVAGVVLVVGALVWCEAAARVSCGAWLMTASGVIGAIALVAWFVALPRADSGERRTTT